MLIVIDGAAGSGKTYFQTKLVRIEWKGGEKIYANYDLKFSDDNEEIFRFFNLDETFKLTHGVLAFDEIQDLAGYWNSMPVAFRNLISHHRHRGLIVYANTQDFKDLHTELRRSTVIRYRCRSIFRIPSSETKKPILQLIRVDKKIKALSSNTDEPRFTSAGKPKYYLISRFWSREYYDTLANIDFERFICRYTFRKKDPDKMGKWTMKIIDRDLILRGKRRL